MCLYVCMLLSYGSVLLSRESREELKKTFISMSQHGMYLPDPHCQWDSEGGMLHFIPKSYFAFMGPQYS